MMLTIKLTEAHRFSSFGQSDEVEKFENLMEKEITTTDMLLEEKRVASDKCI